MSRSLGPVVGFRNLLDTEFLVAELIGWLRRGEREAALAGVVALQLEGRLTESTQRALLSGLGLVDDAAPAERLLRDALGLMSVHAREAGLARLACALARPGVARTHAVLIDQVVYALQPNEALAA